MDSLDLRAARPVPHLFRRWIGGVVTQDIAACFHNGNPLDDLFMKAIMVCQAALFVYPSALHAQAVPVSQDPVLGTWRMEDGRLTKFRDNNSVSSWIEGTADFFAGSWEADPFSEGIRHYHIKWKDGRAWDVDLAKDLSAMRATDSKGVKTVSLRVEELTTYLRTDDIGGLAVNGKRLISAPTDEKPQRIFVRKGDVLAITLARRQGDLRFALEIFRGNSSVVSAKDFVYSTAPNPDWEKTKDIAGYREVGTDKLRDVAMGNVNAPLAATAKGGDERFDRIYFKYVMP